MIATRRALVAVTLAAPALSTYRANAADPEAAAPVVALNTALLAAMKAGRTAPFATRYAALGPAIDRAFDLPAILRGSVGLRWNSLQPGEQQQLLDVFRKFTVSSYTANFDNFGGEKIEVVPSTRNLGADQVVSTKITSGAETTPIDYVMHRNPDGWRAIDVLLNGSISQVAVNRSDWRSLLSSGAGALIAQLQRKVADLSGGAIR